VIGKVKVTEKNNQMEIGFIFTRKSAGRNIAGSCEC
jgi:hypothetical protein